MAAEAGQLQTLAYLILPTIHKIGGLVSPSLTRLVLVIPWLSVVLGIYRLYTP